MLLNRSSTLLAYLLSITVLTSVIDANNPYGAFEANPALVTPGGGQCCVMVATNCCPQSATGMPTCFGSSVPGIQLPGTGIAGGVALPGIQQPGVGPQQPSLLPFPGSQYPGGQFPGIQFPGGQLPGGQFPGGQSPGTQYPGIQFPGVQVSPSQTPNIQSPYPGSAIQGAIHSPGIQWPGLQLPHSEQGQRCQEILREICKYCQQFNMLSSLPQQQPFIPSTAILSQVKQPSGILQPGQTDLSGQLTNVNIKVPVWPTGQAPQLPMTQETPWTVHMPPVNWDQLKQQNDPTVDFPIVVQYPEAGGVIGQPLIDLGKSADMLGQQQLSDTAQANSRLKSKSFAEAVARRWEMVNRQQTQAAMRSASLRSYSAPKLETRRFQNFNNSRSGYVTVLNLQPVEQPLP